ncbi:MULTISPECIES: TolC family protein [Dyadobacter]|uniref:TolC family protein n=1 Tax=Dyadobacter chenhuakuii TaxID=2909339 RepID=A0ABY4XL71_9BACT|nr:MULTISPECIES: TolC family protein [Dyadobacter]MCF2493600.1 TolC family protein [Dyadobacter chenhuakuii]MCF2517847.1 TolC family protein [Dyadobacter sp. CY351]USJ30737.1 TolC family protein [Dyadobacter chenhuakuii]
MLKSLRKSALLFIVFCVCVAGNTAFAQKDTSQAANTYSLEDCIRIALETNPSIKISELTVQTNGNIYAQSKWQRWPSISFSASQGFSSGRNIDPFTNQFVQQNVNSNNYQLGGQLTLFNGFQIKNNIKFNNENYKASAKDLDAARNDIMLNVALSYLQVMTNIELIGVARLQVEASQLQVDRTAKLVEAGTLAESNLLDLKAQLANDELTLVNAENNLETAKLNLKQFMNMPGSEPINVVMIQVADPTLQAYDATIQEIFEVALGNLPQMQAAELRIAAAKTNIDLAKGAALPSLTLNGGIYTAYSSAAPKERFVSDGSGTKITEVISPTDYIIVNSQQLPIVQKIETPNGALRTFGYLDQLNFNRNSAINLNLTIPIFTNFRVKYNVANAKIQQKTYEYQAQQVQLTIRKNVEQAYIDMTNAAKRYSATANQVQALQETFRVSQVRFDVGAINSVEYNIAKANLDRANGNLVQAKYDYVFRTKILDFYMNRPLSDF